MLYSDGLFPTPADITAADPDLALELTSDNLSTTLPKLCSEAYSQCAGIIASKLQSVTGATNFNPSGGASSLHNAAVIWGVRAQTNVVRLRMGQIVMDDLYTGDGFGAASLTAPLRTWLIYWAVVLGYRKLMGRADPHMDRYKRKYDFYRGLTSGEKWTLLRSTGLPYVRVPLPAPGAIYEQGAGTWGAANLSGQSSTGAIGGNFYVAVTWVCQSSPVFYISPLHKNNAESGPSLIYPTTNSPNGLLACVVAADTSLSINIASLHPPTGTVSPSQASVTGVSQGTMIATGWNVYIGSIDVPGPLFLQNATPIPVAVKVYTLPTDPLLNGYILERGQYADANMPMGDMMMRM